MRLHLFNIEARYDDYKFSFRKKATLSYAEKWIKDSSRSLFMAKKITLKPNLHKQVRTLSRKFDFC